MNKKVVIIDAPYFFIDEYYNVAQDEQDEVYFVNGSVPDDLEAKYPIKLLDIKTQYDEIKQWIKCELGTVDAIYSIDERSTIEGNRLSREFNLVKNSPQSILNNRDKACMKKVWLSNKILTPIAKVYDTPNAIDFSELQYPLILKPSLGYASSCVIKIRGEDELRSKIRTLIITDKLYLTKNDNTCSQIMLEECIDGCEYSVDSLWYAGEAMCHFIATKENPHGPLFKDRVYVSDPTLDPKLRAVIEESVEKAIAATGYLTGATHVELRIKDNKCYFLETGCRPGGGGMTYRIFSDSYERNIFKLFYRLYTSSSKDEYIEYMNKTNLPKQPSNLALFYLIQHTEHGKLKEIRGLEEVINRPEVMTSVAIRRVGDKLLSEDIDPGYTNILFCIIEGKKKGIDYALELVDYYESIIQVLCE